MSATGWSPPAICAENEYLDNWPSSIRDLFPDGLKLFLA